MTVFIPYYTHMMIWINLIKNYICYFEVLKYLRKNEDRVPQDIDSHVGAEYRPTWYNPEVKHPHRHHTNTDTVTDIDSDRQMHRHKYTYIQTLHTNTHNFHALTYSRTNASSLHLLVYHILKPIAYNLLPPPFLSLILIVLPIVVHCPVIIHDDVSITITSMYHSNLTWIYLRQHFKGKH